MAIERIPLGIGEEDRVPWQAPQFTEIDMNAEIGAYQRDPLEDADRRRPPQPGSEARGGTTPPDPEQDAASSRR